MSADGSFAYGSAPSPEELARYDLNDFGNAMRLIRLVGGEVDPDTGEIVIEAVTLLYLREIGWIGWNGRHWDTRMGQRLAERRAHAVAQGLVGQRPWIETAVGKKEASDFIKGSGNNGRIKSMLSVAETYLQVELDSFDRDPLAMTVRNGTLKYRRDVGDGLIVHLCAHDPRDRISRMAAVDYDRSATAPLWESSLAAWHPDQEMRDYLRRVAGYIATGYTHEQAFFIWQGKGRDGKSTQVGALRELLGDYANVADVRTFLDAGMRSGADASPDLARLAGDCRLISVSEPPRAARLAEGSIKSFTGGAPITARQLHKQIIEFSPKPKVIMECNSRPVIKGDDDGIWRRLRLVLWEHQVAKADMDRMLPEKLRGEFPGILNWILQGVGDYLAEGLNDPQRVLDAMDDYRKGSSPFGEWFLDCVELAEGVRTPAATFYKSYTEWCEKQGIEKPMSQTAFGNALADRQIIRAGKDAAGRVLRLGAKVRPLETLMQGFPGAGGQSEAAPETPFDPDRYDFGDGQ